MRITVTAAASLASLLLAAPIASAAPKQASRSMTMTMVDGMKLNVKLIKMNGRMMAIVPVEQLDQVLTRSEGHSVTLGGG